MRWGLAIGGLYYYNTSNVFAEEPPFSPSLAHPAPEDAPMPTLDSLSLSKRSKPQQISSNISPQTAIAEPGAFDETEEQASHEGAFNEETGEINWDCPCLGGMAHGPCGEPFRAAFSCFVYSTEEPKGMDCIDRFKGMQDCFREHPDVYGDELADSGPEGPDEPEISEAVDSAVSSVAEDVPISTTPSTVLPPSSSPLISNSSESPTPSPRAPPPTSTLSNPVPQDADRHPAHTSDDDNSLKRQRANAATKQVAKDHGDQGEDGDELVPKEWHDTRKMNEGK